MRIRQLSGLLAAFAAGGLFVAFASSGGVSASMQQGATAGVSVGVGTFGCSLSAAPGAGSTGLTITPSGQNVDIDFGLQDGSAAGSASAELTLHNDGSMPISATWTLESPTGDTGSITASLSVSGGSPSSLPHQNDAATATLTFEWAADTAPASLSANVDVVCNEGAPPPQPLHHSSRALVAPASAGFQQELTARAAIDVASDDSACTDPSSNSGTTSCPDDPTCSDGSTAASGATCPDETTCSDGSTPDSTGSCPDPTTCTDTSTGTDKCPAQPGARGGGDGDAGSKGACADSGESCPATDGSGRPQVDCSATPDDPACASTDSSANSGSPNTGGDGSGATS